MKCPFCGHLDSWFIDSRDVNDGIRRRRQCESCGTRYTTYERLQAPSLFVVKKDRRREEFSREKLLSGIRKACEKRPLPAGAVETLVDDIESRLYKPGRPEISSAVIGDMVVSGLKELDHIAYIRFASVYRDFTDITTLKNELDSLIRDEGTRVSHPLNQLPLIPDDPPITLAGQGRQCK
jgi:transcriptional repressor NrdR